MTEKMGNGKKIILVVCIIVFICSSALLLKTVLTEYNNKKMYEELSNLISTTETDGDTTAVPDYSALYAKNPDFIGWITVPNTTINYPVVQCDNNDYYLYRNFEKKRDNRGTIFMDYQNNPIDFDANTILYGHNSYNATMFSELIKYLELDFYKSNPVFEFNTLYKAYKWKIYGVFITSAKPEEDNGYVFNYIYPYMDGENFEGFMEEINKRRLYVTDVDMNDDDKMLVLSTCIRKLDTYKNGVRTYKADARFVVVARAVRDGESEIVDVENAYNNKNIKYPQIYYDNRNIENPYINDEKWYPKEVVQ